MRLIVSVQWEQSETRRVGRCTRLAGFFAGLALLSPLGAPGCASNRQTVVVWEKTESGAMKLEDARTWCRSEGAEAKGATLRNDRYEADQLGAVFVRCMSEKGWSWKTRVVRDDEAAQPAASGAGGSR